MFCLFEQMFLEDFFGDELLDKFQHRCVTHFYGKSLFTVGSGHG